MERRDAIKYTAMMMGLGLSASTISAMMSGCKVETSEHWTPTFFSPTEAEFIRILAETMLPRTTTPGAADALVDRYLDTIRPLRYTAEENLIFKEELTDFIARAKTELRTDLSQRDEATQLEWLIQTDADAYAYVRSHPDLPVSERPFYLSLKEQILAAYFNAEIVAKEFFAFDPIPGRYDPCIPYTEVGRAWA